MSVTYMGPCFCFGFFWGVGAGGAQGTGWGWGVLRLACIGQVVFWGGVLDALPSHPPESHERRGGGVLSC